MDKELLEAIGQMMDEKLKPINTRLEKLEQGQTKLEKAQTKLKTEMNHRFDKLEFSLNKAWEDIGYSVELVEKHEKNIHSIGV